MSEHPPKLRILLICSGLGRINRGFESFTAECFNELSKIPSFEVFLCKGAGETATNEYKVPSLYRHGVIARLMEGLTGKPRYYWEQVSFGASLIPLIFMLKPQVIYFSDGTLGNLLWHAKRIFKFKFKLLFSNGAPINDLSRWDLVQQVAPIHLERALIRGEDSSRQYLLPYGFDIPEEVSQHSYGEDLGKSRMELNLPESKTIILCSAAINSGHKRLDYLIQEFSRLDPNKYFLLLLGQRGIGSEEVEKLAQELLEPESFVIRTVSVGEIGRYYSVADVFALCSLEEGLARALVEAASYGLPCIVHDYAVPRYVLRDSGFYADLTQPEAFGETLKYMENSGWDKEQRLAQSSQVRERFSWKSLLPQYQAMLEKSVSLGNKDA